jgi:hypothetical protein
MGEERLENRQAKRPTHVALVEKGGVGHVDIIENGQCVYILAMLKRDWNSACECIAIKHDRVPD